MAIKNIIGSLGIIPRMLVKEYDRQKDKIGGLEDENAALRAQMEGAQGAAPGMKKGGKVKSASARADGIAIRGKTRA
jgi:hypothetical protein